ncbi:hypothetical protein OIU84_006389 [Salix udensis]|uniref:Uncharacterized protein n=1 Tax=Salix udensis TaxID=889485 RepID=A0AAD6JYM9_9ROSI|nr:hypothetical protein OIU84_006389 [Salix udensis]
MTLIRSSLQHINNGGRVNQSQLAGNFEVHPQNLGPFSDACLRPGLCILDPYVEPVDCAPGNASFFPSKERWKSKETGLSHICPLQAKRNRPFNLMQPSRVALLEGDLRCLNFPGQNE